MAETPSPVPSAEYLLSILASMEQDALASRPGLPLVNKEVRDWTGVAYKIGDFEVVSPMNQISEMLAYPESITPVPGTQAWFLGVTNVRSHLLPIIDLAQYLQLQSVEADKISRVLVARIKDVNVGLLVPHVLGIRHFDEKQHLKMVDQPFAQMRGLGVYVEMLFKAEEGEWPLFNLDILISDSRFRNAAA